MKIVVSACLLGRNCKYNGGNNRSPAVEAFCRGQEVIPLCPEELAGAGTPREPVEILRGRLTTRGGKDVHDLYCKGVLLAVEAAGDAACAVLQSRSPTCGVKQVYDGTFSGTRREGSGLFAQALREKGLRLIDAEDVENAAGEEKTAPSDRPQRA